MHEGKHGILDDVDEIDDLFGSDEEGEEEDCDEHDHEHCHCHDHHNHKDSKK